MFWIVLEHFRKPSHFDFSTPTLLSLIAIQPYYVGFISKCNGIIGVDAVGPPVLFEGCGKAIASGGATSYLRVMEVMEVINLI